MKALLLAITALCLNIAQAQTSDIQNYIAIQSQPIHNENLLKIESLAKDLILKKKISKLTNSCGDVITFKGPKSHKSNANMQLWIHGISNELATLNLDEDIKLHSAPLNYNDIRLKITLLADRALQTYDVKSVETLAKSIHFATRKDLTNHYFFFGDYLDTETGWMTAIVLIKIAEGEAVLMTNAGNCF